MTPDVLDETPTLEAPEPLYAESLLTSGVDHAFFTRKGGVSSGIYASLQCGRGAKRDSEQNIDRNRARAAAIIGAAPHRLLSCQQVHSPKTVTVTRAWATEDSPEADAMVTNRRGLALGILTADCAPVLFLDREAMVIGAAHAGWKGALGGVLESTVAAMSGLGAIPERIMAVVGPCITQRNYQVDMEYRERFMDDDPANAKFFRADDNRSGAAVLRYRFDLPGYCAARLHAAGVEVVERMNRCTYSEDELFYSNRRALHRGESDYGRGLSAIMLS